MWLSRPGFVSPGLFLIYLNQKQYSKLQFHNHKYVFVTLNTQCFNVMFQNAVDPLGSQSLDPSGFGIYMGVMDLWGLDVSVSRHIQAHMSKGAVGL